MAVNYIAVEKKIPAEREMPSKYYPQIVTTGEVTYRELAIEITKISPASTTDVIAVIEGLLEVVPKLLGTGKIVRLGDFGSFSLVVNGESAETADKLNRQHIKRTSVKFRPGKVFKQKIDDIEFKKKS